MHPVYLSQKNSDTGSGTSHYGPTYVDVFCFLKLIQEMWRRQGVVDPVRGVLLAGLLYFIHAFSTQSSRWIFFSTESLWKLLCATGLSTKPHTCVVVHYLSYPGIWSASTKWQILKTRPGKSEDESNSKHQEATFSLIACEIETYIFVCCWRGLCNIIQFQKKDLCTQ